jgi:hypothetical protein
MDYHTPFLDDPELSSRRDASEQDGQDQPVIAVDEQGKPVPGDPLETPSHG